MSSRRGGYFEVEFTLEVGVSRTCSCELPLNVTYFLDDDGYPSIDSVAIVSETLRVYPADWLLDDPRVEQALVELVDEYERDMAEGYRDSEAEAKMEELREKPLTAT